MNFSADIARADATDASALITLIKEFCLLDQHDFDEARVATSLQPLLTDDRYGVVWKIGDPPIGYAVVTWGYSLESGGVEALIDEIYLRARGQGLGQLLVERIIEDCRARGCTRMFLETERHNQRVRGFYQRAGFVEDDSVWMSRWL